jgi:opacity protein-like surface antigen
MRRIVVAAILAGLAQGAQAADMPDFSVLRGAVTDGIGTAHTNWQGFYIGGQFGIGSSDMYMANATRDITAKMLDGLTIENEGKVSGWPILNTVSKQSTGFGGFVGYNAQWDDAVIGVEASYLHGEFGGAGSGSMSRFFTTSTGYTDDVTYTGTAAMKIHDMGSLRVRGGWAWNSFMPYAFAGVAMGMADIAKTSHVFGTQVNLSAAPGFTNVPFDLSTASVQNNHFIFGYSAGLGVDVMLFGNLFLRGEWEYLKFTAPINTSVNTVRGGVGYKF